MRNLHFSSLFAMALAGCGGQSVDDGAASDGSSSTAPAAFVTCSAQASWSRSGNAYAQRRGYLGFSADGSRLAWSDGFYETVRFELDSATGADLARFEPSAEQPPRNELLGLDEGWQRELLGSYELWLNEPATGLSHACAGSSAYADVTHALLSSDGSHVFRASCNVDEMGWDVLNGASGELETRIILATTCSEASVAERNGDVLLTSDDVVAFLPAGDDMPSAVTTHPHEPVDGVLRGIVGAALDVRSSQAATIAMDGSVQLYDLPSFEPRRTSLEAHVCTANDNAYAPTFRASPVAFTNDGTTLAFVAADGDLVLLRSDTLEETSRIALPPAVASDALPSVTALAFAPDDSTLAVVSDGSLEAHSCRRGE